ncbi:hypothetical protein K1T71_000759 [Dendrolimus kikuchii]|uniref:Uncharacterized protein n=1 Tax=Dendrolimus kikuchii TaxID=765133 RepID=A0ACC1DL55_9NEOP|nr:hypothetical protein K1T71_000759 [Dendrolimus kikuchii]
MKFLNIILSILLLILTICGDYIVFKSKYSDSQLFRGFADSLVHASIGCVSAITFFSNGLNIPLSSCICNVSICTVLSSFIDVDHFIVARTFNFKEFVSKRGIFHCTSFCLLITGILYIIYYNTRNPNILLLKFMFLIAYSSHHIRDSNRRGLWLYPYGHTPAIDYYLSVIIICILPHIYVYLYSHLKLNMKTYVNNYTVV